jgi:hypothetical protein
MAYAQVTLAQLRTLLADRWENDPFWTTVDADLAINDALRLWGGWTGFWQASYNATQIANDPFVVLNTPMSVGSRVTLNGVPLESTSLEGLDYGRPTWQSARGTPSVWAPVDLLTFVVTPASTSNITLVVEGLRTTPTLTSASDYVQLGEEEQSAILDYALHAAAFKRGAAFLEMTKEAHDRFKLAAVLRNNQLRQSLPFREVYQRNQKQLRVPGDDDDPKTP